MKLKKTSPCTFGDYTTKDVVNMIKDEQYIELYDDYGDCYPEFLINQALKVYDDRLVTFLQQYLDLDVLEDIIIAGGLDSWLTRRHVNGKK